MNLLITYFNRKNPGFVAGYHKSSAVDNSGIRHNGVAGIVTNTLSGQPVQNVTITGEGKKKFTSTDKDGVYKLNKLRVGDMKITITAPGYDAQVVDVKILRSKTIELNVSLLAQVISMATA